MRQNDRGLASIVWTIAARMTDAWVMATVFPRILFCVSSGSGANSGSGAYSRQISPAMEELTQHVEH